GGRVVSRGVAARAERTILAVWELHRSWTRDGGMALHGVAATGRTPAGSEQVLGASERRWGAGSEVRLAGASERYRLGASELRYLGASEIVSAGASEWRLGGASERRLVAASEWLYAGASEPRYEGASERAHLGASGRPAGGPRRGGGGAGSPARPAEPVGRCRPDPSRSCPTPTCRSSAIPRTRP